MTTKPQLDYSDSTATATVRRPDRDYRLAVIVMGVLLAVCAILFISVVSKLQLVFKKAPVEIKDFGKPLKELPTDLGPWRMVSVDERLSGDIEHVLGTQEYIMRTYVDTRTVPAAKIEAITSAKTSDDRRQLIGELWQSSPEAVISLSLTYYTGLVDTVAHIPERCFVADGFAEASAPANIDLPMGPDKDPVSVRFIPFQAQAGLASRMDRSVGYFFKVNDVLTPDSFVVRQKLQNLLERYGYYAKVELMTVSLSDEPSQRVMGDFLSHALPEINKCLPDWQKVEAQK